jgi:tetratricopeptide (TPR) repeat protein
MVRPESIPRLAGAALLLVFPAAAAETVEIKGRVTNQLTEAQYRAVEVIVTDRLGVVLGRTQADRQGRYELKITGPRYIILKANLEGFPEVRYQLDTEEIKESTQDREENKAFGELRLPTYYQNITFGVRAAPATLDEMLSKENPAAVKAYQAARRQKEAGDLSKAVASLEKLVRQYPDFYLGYIELGMTLAAQQENDRALEVFTQAQKLRADHSWTYVGLGLALNNKQDYRTAAQHLEKAVQLDPDSINAQFQLGQAAFKLGEHDRAIQCFERVIALNPKFNPLAYKTLAAIYIHRKDSQGAARALQSYLAQFPDAPDAEKVKQILNRLGR